MATSSSNTRNKSASPLGPGLSDESRKAMNNAFDSLSDWRNDIATVAEKNSAVVFERMAAAAKTVGWPPDFVDMTRQQMQTASKMQLQMMDQIMDVWEQQMKSPGSPMSVATLDASRATRRNAGRSRKPFPVFLAPVPCLLSRDGYNKDV